ncbi:uncharacterized protein MONBRDRAFT_8118 [Monosiga brevicollis MX1]|uniref:Uncharacterized protein n=1 Tax=Monosiga brevicollis TaxID=81824 RepID=A9UZ36_MONBE|nr:uncharacterized protein MONBRDRAFT_8118 [Monosiga brevicollis MX1]EDQ89716.1 predicted protein [Monosiga brevicollis MX1]|eukprot:XP_001745745.1 hypothetical protein [Monosiga brevicollis MX1]
MAGMHHSTTSGGDVGRETMGILAPGKQGVRLRQATPHHGLHSQDSQPPGNNALLRNEEHLYCANAASPLHRVLYLLACPNPDCPERCWLVRGVAAVPPDPNDPAEVTQAAAAPDGPAAAPASTSDWGVAAADDWGTTSATNDTAAATTADSSDWGHAAADDWGLGTSDPSSTADGWTFDDSNQEAAASDNQHSTLEDLLQKSEARASEHQAARTARAALPHGHGNVKHDPIPDYIDTDAHIFTGFNISFYEVC